MKRVTGLTIFVLIIVGMFVLIDQSDSKKMSEQVENKMFTQTETKVYSESTVEELKKILETFQNDLAPQINNDFERKLAERMYVEMKKSGETIDVKELIIRAKDQADFERAWLEHAKSEYGIVITGDEVDEWIEKGPDATVVESQRRYAEAKEMSVYQLNHDYYRDQYMKWVVWEDLIPLVTDRYEQSSEHVLDNNRLIELYEQEMEVIIE
ncbi:hypothetical protein OE059_06410 [Exiguobacterium profundum]|uniref:SurA N-terminal domain-containing protein n=1 Tax=Exiguobacterium profundum TaxID=307643 RepID=A0ABY8B5R8_9BACL|nr:MULTISPECIES: hypothetical protein [Exiguobacterium]WED56483.1 hypothetical protein OE059_06410 [Exiguobacterium profundum]